ncbi:MAG: GNAT family N-acetyltransferase [Candidatus Brocadiaceae bacterium]|nr:GNAT family N-acetyltransferase [Candidatus Brocadiaceae bacterium]
MEVRFIGDTEGIKAIEPQWESLLGKVGSVPVFLTREWVRNWLKLLCTKTKPFIFTLWNGNELKAFFPLGLKSTFFVKRLEFIGHDDGDYLDFIVDTDSKEASIEILISSLREKKGQWDVCDLKDFPEESSNYELLRELLKKEGWKAISYDTWRCPYLEINGDWDSFLKQQDKKFKYNLKQRKRHLESLGKLEFKKIQAREELEHYLPQVFEIHRKRWKGYAIYSRFSTPGGQEFYSELARDYLARKMLRLDLLLLNEKVIAFSYSFQWNGRYLHYTPAYDPCYAKYASGMILLMHILEDAFKSGLREIDFTRGELQYKSRWISGARQNKRIVFSSPTLKGRVTFPIYLLYLFLYAEVRRLKILRVILAKLQQWRASLGIKITYIPPDAVLSPVEVFKATASKVDPPGYFSSKPIFFKDGRTALLKGLRLCGFATEEVILIPAYVCGSVVSTIEQAGLRVRFYEVKENLEPDFKDLESKSTGASALLIIHYFGFSQPLDKVLRFCSEKGLLLIEDCAHALFSRVGGRPLGTFGAFGIFSLRKTLPLPDGGMLLLNTERAVEAKNIGKGYSISPTVSLLEKWVEFKTGLSLRSYLLQNDRLRNGYIRRDSKKEVIPENTISTISLRLFREVKVEEIVNKRRENYNYYLKSLADRKDLQVLFPELTEGVCPVGFPVLIANRDGVYKWLLRKGINLRTFWDVLPEEVYSSGYPEARKLSEHILILPTHQSLKEEHLDYVIKQFTT